jgi:hypothetical protein
VYAAATPDKPPPSTTTLGRLAGVAPSISTAAASSGNTLPQSLWLY